VFRCRCRCRCDCDVSVDGNRRARMYMDDGHRVCPGWDDPHRLVDRTADISLAPSDTGLDSNTEEQALGNIHIIGSASWGLPTPKERAVNYLHRTDSDVKQRKHPLPPPMRPLLPIPVLPALEPPHFLLTAAFDPGEPPRHPRLALLLRRLAPPSLRLFQLGLQRLGAIEIAFFGGTLVRAKTTVCDWDSAVFEGSDFVEGCGEGG